MGNRRKQQGYAPLTRRYRMDRMLYKMSETFFSLFVFLVFFVADLSLRPLCLCGESQVEEVRMGNRRKQQGYAPLTRRYRMDRI